MKKYINNPILLIIITIAITWACVWYFGNDRDLMKQLKESEAIREKLVEQSEVYVKRIDSIKNKYKELETIYFALWNKNKQNDKDIKDSVNNVYNLNERQIDSAIRHHTHKPFVTD